MTAPSHPPESSGRRPGRGEGSTRAGRMASRGGVGVHQLPWRTVTNPFRPLEVLSEDQIEAIHNASLRILAEIGMDFLHPEALSILAAGGAAGRGRDPASPLRPRVGRSRRCRRCRRRSRFIPATPTTT